MIRLKERLLAVSKQISKNSIVVDVGTDHGLLPMYLIENKIAKRAIAADVVDSICKKTEKEIEKNGFSDKIKVICSDGLCDIKDKEVDTIVIAGMGGILIRDILDARKSYLKDKKLVLSPHRDVDIVRRYLHSINMKIKHEEMIFDGKDKYYTIIVAISGDEKEYSPLEYELGRKNIKEKSETFIKYLKVSIKKFEEMQKKLEKGKNTDEKIEYLKAKVEEYKGLIGK